MTEGEMINALWYHYGAPYKKMPNVFIWDGCESDFIAISRAGITNEIEIKCSYSDFKNDFKKSKHKRMMLRDNSSPNRFYFLAPDGIIPHDAVPEYAGLMIYKDRRIEIVKDAPLLHKNKNKFGIQLNSKGFARWETMFAKTMHEQLRQRFADYYTQETINT